MLLRQSLILGNCLLWSAIPTLNSSALAAPVKKLQSPTAVLVHRHQHVERDVALRNYLKHQKNRLLSKDVLGHALTRPTIAKLALVQRQKQPVAWLKSRLRVETDFEKASVRIQLKEGTLLEQASIVGAVVEAYYHQIEPYFRAQQNERLLQYQADIRRYRAEADRHRRLAQIPVLARNPVADKDTRQKHLQIMNQAKSWIAITERSIRSLETEHPPDPRLVIVQEPMVQ